MRSKWFKDALIKMAKKCLQGAAAHSIVIKKTRLEDAAAVSDDSTESLYMLSAPLSVPAAVMKEVARTLSFSSQVSVSLHESSHVQTSSLTPLTADKLLPPSVSSIPKQFRAKVTSLQALADAVHTEETPSVQLKKKGKAWISEMKKHFQIAGKKKRLAETAVSSASEINHLLKKISLQLEQMTEILCHLISSVDFCMSAQCCVTNFKVGKGACVISSGCEEGV
ncbi:hypothetical protein EMPG_12881 [Blastomyces silverae]|uniref:Uncharacterized protein n=1 Tax=Blastomyces silverae TaxID=2060906 RepID=A0A0H1BLR6_9EURO|nr:hypothetical protein EMPG_12881 [Blastomyces silverae]